MADKYPNLPGMVVDFRDGALSPNDPPTGPVVAVIGTAAKGPAESPSRVSTAPTALTRFGLEGTLGRGLIEAIQGGARNCFAYRVLATRGKVEHIGDVLGADGYTIEPTVKGSDALSKVSVLYDNAEDILKLYDTATGILIYSNDPDALVDLGLVSVTGEKKVGNAFGSIGLQVKVATSETAQRFDSDALNLDILTLTTGNLALLGVLSATNAYVAQLMKSTGDVVAEVAVSSYNAATRAVTLAADIDILEFPEGAEHDIRFVSTTKSIRADKILNDRIFATDGVQPLVVTPGSDFNGLRKVANDTGWTVDVTDSDGTQAAAEVSPAKMNMYEAMEDAFLDLEAATINVVHFPGVYLDDLALDGETAGVTALPDEFFAAAPTTITVAGHADRCKLVFANADAQVAAVVLLAANRGKVWATFTDAQSDAADEDFGFGHEAGELVRTARILNWEDVSGQVTQLTVYFDRDVSLSFTADDDTNIVDAALTPTVEIRKMDDVLMYHRAVEVDGELLHQWYPETSDADGYEYNEVNFGYRLAAFCNDTSENEVSVIGVIGVRPPTNHFNPAAISNWIGKVPVYDEDGNVSTNGKGLLGYKFVSGRLSDDTTTQFLPGLKATSSGELDGDEILLDGNGFEIDLGKFLSVACTWPIFNNEADLTGSGYINSSAGLYAGLLASLPSWSGATAKRIGGRGVRLPVKLAKRHQDSLVGARYIVLDSKPEGVIVVDAPSAALPTSDYTRNMTVRLVSEAVQLCRDVARPYFGEPLNAYRKAALDTAIKKALFDLQKNSGGSLESFTADLSQTNVDKRRGSASLVLVLKVINELREISVSVALSA